MKNFLRNHFLSLFAMLLVSAATAQTFTGVEAAHLVEGSQKVVKDPTNGNIQLVVMQDRKGFTLDRAQGWLTNLYGLDQHHSFVPVRSWKDQIGAEHHLLQQYYRGIPIQGAEVRAHMRNGKVHSISADVATAVDAGSESVYSESAALNRALAHIGAEVWRWDEPFFEQQLKKATGNQEATHYPTGSLMYLQDRGSWRLVWQFEVYASQPLSRGHVFVDAINGRVVAYHDKIYTADATGTAVTKYSGTRTITVDSLAPDTFRLQESGRGGGIETYDLNQGFFQFQAVDFLDVDNYWNNTNTQQDEVATDAHWAAEMFYDYFFNDHGRNSYDDAAAPLLQYVHYASGYPNAFWDGASVSMGDGDGTSTGPWATIDIVAHEYTHGVIENSANLVFSYESGALNEAFCDIFAVLVDEYAKGSVNWNIGEQVSLNGSPFRSLSNPNGYGQPDTYQGTNWEFGSADNGGVHTNSGVANYWFYLLAQGGAGVNDNGDAYNISGIGLTDAGAIAYRALTVYLSSSSQFADARTYTIQAAEDLFGACSTQSIAVTNAWYAVGVGAQATVSVPSAGFTADISFSCSLPQDVSFTNTSTNATSYAWDFGDGNNSSASNPTHTYTSAGTYTVQLVATSTSTCGTVSDTMTQSNLITITAGGGPVAPSCTPVTTGYCCGIGIHNFTFGGGMINNSTTDGADSYQDYTCSNSATVTAGNSYAVSIQTGPTYLEDSRIYIDYNNDGSFSSGELVFSTNSTSQYHTGSIAIPTSGVALSTPLRMRVITDYYSNNISSGCYSPQYGQVEDYTITVQPNTAPPTANFSGTPTTVNVGGAVNFTDLSTNATSYSWYFPGGFPSTSSAQNPTGIVYNSLGTYDVKLVVSNPFGSDSLTLSNYISVVNTANMCSSTSSAATTGVLYDSGGPSGSYSNNQSCSFLIDPGCATSITLSFSQFQLESCCDYFRVYDGTSTAGTLLLSANGSSIPGSVTASSGKMYITFSSDGSVVGSGWTANWSATVPTSGPTAGFTVSNATPAYGETVTFTDATTNQPATWNWDFGDGVGTSTDQNPTYTYTTGGTYTVSLITNNCHSADTATMTVTAQGPPVANVTPIPLVDTVACGDSTIVPLYIANNGSGDLTVQIAGTSSGGTTEMLALTYGVDLTREYPNTIAGINQYYSNYNLTTINTTSASALQTALTGKDVFLIPEQETGSTSVFAGFASVLQSFVFNGGTVIIVASPNHANATGLFDVAGSSAISSGTIQVVNTTHAISDGLSTSFGASSATYYATITNSDYNTIANYGSSTVIGYRSIGAGYAIYHGYDFYYTTNSNFDLALANAVEFGGNNLPNWLNMTTVVDTVVAGDTLVVDVEFNAAGMLAGVYAAQLDITTNDPGNASIAVPCTLTVTGQPLVTLSQNAFDFGNVLTGASVCDTVVVSNQGCDTLNVTNITSTASEFSVSATNFDLPPFTDSSVVICFSPTAIATYNDSVTVITNGGDSIITVTGVGVGAPTIGVAPSPIVANITSCNDSVTIPVVVSNTGLGPLEFNIEGVSGNTSTGTPNVLLLYRGFDSPSVAEDELVATGLFTYSDLHLLQNPTSLTMAQLDTIDVVLVWSGSSWTNGTQIGDTLKQFVDNGGGVVICTYSLSSPWALTGGIFDAGYSPFLPGSTTSVSGTFDVASQPDPNHPIFDGMGGNPTYWSNSNFSNPTLNTGGTILAQDAGGRNVIAENADQNVMAIVTYPSYMNQSNADHDLMLANMLYHVWQGGNVDWMSLSLNADTVAIADSSVVQVSFNALGMSNGQYIADLTFNSNDPSNPLLVVPCTMNVSGPAELIVGDTCIAFGNVMQGSSSYDSVFVFNAGCDTLMVTNVTSTASEFAATQTSYTVMPGDTAWVVVDFSPTGVGAFSGTLTIQTPVGDSTVCLNGTGTVAPDILVSPNPVVANLVGCNDSLAVPVTVYNVGGANLVYSVDAISNGVDSTSFRHYYVTGGYTDHVFSGIPTSADSVYLNIYMYGDFNSTTEYAQLYVDNQYIGVIPDFSSYSVNYSIAFGAADVAAWAADGQITVRLDNSSSVNIGYTDIHQVQLIVPGSTWLTDPMISSTTVVGGDSSTFDLWFNNVGLENGQYITDLSFSSNDPGTPSLNVPCTLNVIGTPVIELSAGNIDMGTALVGATNTEPLWVYNTGCDTLSVTNILPSVSDFGVDTATFDILPGDSLEVTVSFTPSSVGSISGNIQIFTNAVDTLVTLSGIGAAAPQITINPDTLSATVNCGDSVTVPLVVGNIGAGALDFTVEYGSGFGGGGNLDFFDGFEQQNYNQWTDLGSQTYSIISSGCPVGNYCLEQVGGNSSHYNGMEHVFSTPVQPSYISFWVRPGATTAYDAYVLLGKTSTTAGLMWFYARNDGQMGAYVSTSNNALINYTPGQWYQVELKNIDFTAQTYDFYIDGVLLASNFQFRSYTPNLDYIQLYNFDNSTTAYDHFVVGNGAYNPLDWLSFTPDSSNVAPGGSDTVYVTMSAAGLLSGQYTGEISINSNDPANSPLVVPCTLDVSGPPFALLSDTCLNYGNLVAGGTLQDTLTLINQGCDTLEMINILPGNSAYTVVSATSGMIGSGDSIQIIVEFAPTAIQSYNSTLQIFSNNLATQSVCLTGSGTGAPVITTTPSSVTASLSSCGDSTIVPLVIGNIGAGDLHWTTPGFTQAYDSTSTQSFTSLGTGSYTTHVFSGMPAADSVYITITMAGDFNSTSEYATLTVDGTYIGIIPDGSSYFPTYTYSFTGSQAAAWLADGTISVLVDNSSSVNVGYYGDIHEVHIWTSETDWVVAGSGSGTVTIGGSQTVDLAFNSTGMAAGQYITDFVIDSDDPTNPQVVVPCTLNVVDFPCADFSYALSTCTGQVTFTDATANTPTNWAWDFGGLGTSTSQNPTYTFSTAGTYTVQLIATNSNGSDTVSQSVTITSLGGPVTASCASPATTGYCCNMGVHQFTFAGISNASADGSAGYQDFSCTAAATVTESYSYSISVITGTSYAENVGVWIDYNNDGVFQTTEQVFTSTSTFTTHTGTVSIPLGSAVLNTPLRLRVGTDYFNNTAPDGCNSVQYGQYEDYSVVILPLIQVPVASFSYSQPSSCEGTTIFADGSSNTPTSWAWNFGDATTSTAQNPTHSYTSTGTYTVELIACNSDGCDTTTQSVTVSNVGAVVGATCYPQTTSYCCGFGITNVAFNNISNASGNGADGYQDYSCTDSTTVMEGATYTLTVNTSATIAENVGAWIDYNNDGVFAAGEKVLTSNNVLGTHTASVTIPTTGVPLNTPLRMRIGSDYYINAAPDPCTDVQYGQFEDYAVIVTPDNQPPVAGFGFDQPNGCEGLVNFTDSSTNYTSTWNWNFGDSATDTAQHPSHTYTATGTYTVELIACNNNGCDTTTQTVTISGISDVASATCSPQTIAYSGGAGITNVTLNTINNSSNYASDGYVDYTCVESTDLTEGLSYTLSVSTGGASENVVAWIDYNNDGSFAVSEQVLSSTSTGTATTTVVPPATAVQATPLRMRVGSDLSGNAVPDGCSDAVAGQYEDYRVVIYPDTAPPVANFNLSVPNSCEGEVVFSDQSTSSSSIIAWIWSFGDLGGSAAQNPTHTYTATGTYTVQLIACNAYGCDTTTQQVTISGLTQVATATCYPQTTNYCCGFGITNVSLEAINNSTAAGSDGYQDYSCTQSATLTIGQAETLTITTGTSAENVRAWIDYNNDGSFTAGEEVLASSNQSTHTASVVAPTGAVTYTELRMRVGSDANANPVPDGCTDAVQGQYEDYSITILPDTAPPVADFSFNIPNSCQGDVDFTDLSLSGQSILSWTWNFGDASSASTQNASHTYAATGSYTVQLIVCNAFGCDTATQTVSILGLSQVGAPVCTPQTTNFCCGYGITNVNFNTINNSTSNASEGYRDFTCNQSTSLTIGQAQTLSVTTGTGAETVRAWIDYNNDGAFTAGEEVLASANILVHTSSVVAPANATTYTPLRMRIGSDASSNPTPDGCTDAVGGQYEDYEIVIFPDTTPAVASFTYSLLYECQGEVAFTDGSSNGPTTWLWNFGDGDTSSAVNPTHTFDVAGNYSVQLTVCNAYGCNSSTIVVSVPGVTSVAPAGCTPATTAAQSNGYGITNVVFNTINSTTPDGSEGYRDLTCSQSTNVMVNQSYNLSVVTSTSNAENVRAWIDYNNDGAFAAGELVMISNNTLTNHSATVTIPGTAITNTPLRMRIGSDAASQAAPDGCTDVMFGQYEDYAVTVYPDTMPPVAGFIYSINDACAGIVQFLDTSSNNPTQWHWDFGDGDSATVANPMHTFENAGIYIVTLTASNANGSDQATATITVNSITAAFTVAGTQEQGQTLTFTATSPGAIAWDWDFGDANSATVQAINHSYANAGTYIVSLEVSNGIGCTDSVSDTLDISPTGIFDPTQGLTFNVYPSPTRGPVTIEFDVPSTQDYELLIYNALGQVVQYRKLEAVNHHVGQFNLTTFGRGLYTVVLKGDGVGEYRRVLVE